MLLKSI